MLVLGRQESNDGRLTAGGEREARSGVRWSDILLMVMGWDRGAGGEGRVVAAVGGWG